MSNEVTSASNVREKLNESGFGFVQREPLLSGSTGDRPDIIAWASNATGELIPWVAVEIKSGKFKLPDLALPALSKYRDLLGTRDHYAVINGHWFKADRGVRSLEPVDGPTPPLYGAGGFLADEELATSLLSAQLWRETHRRRASDASVHSFFPNEVLYETALPGIQLSDDEFVPVESDVLRRARRRAIVSHLVGGRSTGEYVSSPVIAEGVATLVGDRVGGTVLDPFCGTGSFLWAVLDRAVQQEGSAEFVGFELNPMVAQAAEAIGRSERMATIIEVANAYEADLPLAQVVVTAPPLGLRLREPHQLLDGTKTMDGEAAAVDISLRGLQSGGRAVFHLGAGFTFKRNLERYRRHLAEDLRVAALIGLPSGAIPGTTIRSVLLVIDRAAPGETFIAQLGEDWEAQLGFGGAAVEEALAHLDGHGPTTLGEL